MDVIRFVKGEKVAFENKEAIITRMNTIDTVTIEEISTGINHLVHVSSINPIPNKNEKLDDVIVLTGVVIVVVGRLPN